MPTRIFNEFVDVVFDGNQAKAAAALGVHRSVVSRICSGKRGVSKSVAERAERLSEGRYTKEQFIWPDAKHK